VWLPFQPEHVMAFIRRLLREPMLHFAVIGGMFFVMWWSTHPGAGRDETRIVVTPADVQRLRALAARQWGHAPDPKDTRALVDAYVREEILYREAMASGLDRDDVVIRRRLVQKMDALAQVDFPEPTPAELEAYWKTHAADYALGQRVRLEQVFFSTDLRGKTALADAVALLATLSQGAGAGTSAAVAAGDPFMLPRVSEHQTQQAIARDYGDAFARRVFELPQGVWQGPLVSILGVHLVRVDARDEGPAASFAAVQDRVRQDWLQQRQTQAQQAAYAQLRKRYTVDVPVDLRVDGAGNMRVADGSGSGVGK
jgi:hypothetical protein